MSYLDISSSACYNRLPANSCIRVAPKEKYHGSWANFQYDYDAAKILIAEKKMTWRDFFKPLPRPTYYAIFAWDDPMPFVYSLARAVYNKIRRLLGLE